jgi:hypothetical protein
MVTYLKSIQYTSVRPPRQSVEASQRSENVMRKRLDGITSSQKEIDLLKSEIRVLQARVLAVMLEETE